MRRRFKRSFSDSCKQSHEQPRDNERALLPSQPCCDCRLTGNGHWYSAQVQHARAADSEHDASSTRRRSKLGTVGRELERVPRRGSCFLRSSASSRRSEPDEVRRGAHPHPFPSRANAKIFLPMLSWHACDAYPCSPSRTSSPQSLRLTIDPLFVNPVEAFCNGTVSPRHNRNGRG